MAILVTVLGCSALAQPHSTSLEEVNYQVTFVPELELAQVRISIADATALSEVSFIPLKDFVGKIDGSGTIERRGKKIYWRPNATKAWLSYSVKPKTQKTNGGYDAIVTQTWALMRGEDLFPSFRAKKQKGATCTHFIDFHLPKQWPAVNTGWLRSSGNRFELPRESRALVRPKGWLIAGKLGTRHELVGQTAITISAPKGHDFRQMETLAFISLVWPQFEKTFRKLPNKIMIAGASDPMWRGGLSSPTSLFVHSDRPLVSENGTSTLIHELIHVITGIHGDDQSDWFVEGLAEYYSVELLSRAGAYNSERRTQILRGLGEWGAGVTSLLRKGSYGPYTARATVLVDELDKEIQTCSKQTKTIDDYVHHLIGKKTISLDALRDAFLKICKAPSKTLASSLLKPNSNAPQAQPSD